MTTILIERYRLADILRQELDQSFSREDVTFSASDIPLCGVVGQVTLGAPVAAAVASNAGNGVISALALGGAAEAGVYSLECGATASNAGTFGVFTPSGLRLRDAVVGEPYDTPHLKLTIGAGTVDFAKGDIFTVTVPPGSGKYKLLAPAAVDGTQRAAGIAIAAYDATLADVRGVIINRDAKVIGELLSWPTGTTSAQKSKALAQLAALGIKNCKGV